MFKPTLQMFLSLAAVLAFAVISNAQADDAFLPRLVNTSTVPSNGDVNPYGVAFVPDGFPSGGHLAAGDVLASNFNNADNVQGTGTTIVSFSPLGDIAPQGSATVFFSSKLKGLSTALGVLRKGFVLVGNVPTTDGTFATIGQGALQSIDKDGRLLQTWTNSTFLDGPWDLTIADHGDTATVYVSNVLNGTVSRLDFAVAASGLKLLQWATIARGYTVAPNSAAVVLGPTGLALDEDGDTLYVASTGDNAVYAVSHAATRSTPVVRGALVFDGPQLRGPLALRRAPNGDLLTANGDAVNGDVLHPSEIVEFTRWGHFVREYDVDPSQGGAFGLDTRFSPDAAFNYAVIDDVTNTLAVSRRPSR
jgi:DNA-binding beta-propeller fold protein YncE